MKASIEIPEAPSLMGWCEKSVGNGMALERRFSVSRSHCGSASLRNLKADYLGAPVHLSTCLLAVATAIVVRFHDS